MSIKGTPSFTAGNIAAPNLSASFSALRSIKDSISDEEARRRQLILDDEARQQRLLDQSNVDRTYGLQEANMERQIAKDEADAILKATGMQLTSEHRAQILANQAEAAKVRAEQFKKTFGVQQGIRKDAENERVRKREIEQGIIEGGFIPLNESVTTRENQNVYDPTKGAQVYENLSSQVGAGQVNDDAVKQAYHEYQLKNNPEYVKSTLDKAGDTLADVGLFGPRLLEKGINVGTNMLFGDNSEAAKYEKSKATPAATVSAFDYKNAPQDIKSYDEFKKGYVNSTPITNSTEGGSLSDEERVKYDTEAKNAIKSWVVRDVNSEAVTNKDVEVTKDIPKNDLLKQGLLEIEKSGATGNREQGMKTALLAKVEKIDGVRQKEAGAELKALMKQMDRATTQRYKMALIDYKAKVKSNTPLTRSEKLDIAIKEQTRKLNEQKLYEGS